MLLPMSPTDSVFLTVESPQTPMHVGGLELFEPAEDFTTAAELFARLSSGTDVAPLFRKRARRSLGTAGQWAWEEDRDFDLRHHVRHNSLPKPGRVLELLALCSRLHGTLLDRERPLWELHFIEGLADGRFALYLKVHHALLDGVSAQRLLQRVLTKDPAARDLPPPWANRPKVASAKPVPKPDDTAPPSPEEVVANLLRSARDLATDVAGIPGALVRTLNRSLQAQSAPISFAAPRSMFNVPISGSRRFAAQSWPMERIGRIRKRVGCTVNDVVLAACSGALRSYLLSFEALPETSLIAMVPVALRVRDRDRESGNAVGAVMCTLGTELADPAERLRTVRRSMKEGKQALSELSPLQILAMTGIGMSPLMLQSVPGYAEVARPPFNLIISNVPGPRSPLYLNGARLDGIYPLSIPYHGQALNITCTSYAGELSFGLTGCRRTVPHLQRMLGYLDDELTALEQAVG
ncbi:MAG: wax ester/triacylglycerol synthase family O-acyltransferase [Actinobacteria bacterium]|nr:wax ester/triacylglycerol synthase family O-acyltransferase [Actinomycetota bacterium]